MLRKYSHCWWCHHLRHEAYIWLNNSNNSIPPERRINLKAIWDCLCRANLSTYWDWADGSRLLFWRWKEWWKFARDGDTFYHELPPPRWMGRNIPADTWDYKLKLREKEDKLRHRRYLEKGFIDCLVPWFGVPKGTIDIHLVWDAMRNGYNTTLWTPSFWFPTLATLTNLVCKWLPGTVMEYLTRTCTENPDKADWQRCYQLDMDVGEMYLNYMLHFSERHLFGVRMDC